MKIGIFGGSFNPPHNMHKNIAINLIKYDYVDKVIFVPVGDNYNKDGLIQFKYRYDMIKIMISESDNLEVSNIGFFEKYQYTYQVLDYFSEQYKNSDIYFICGIDNLNGFYYWKEYQYILDNYKLLVVNRKNGNSMFNKNLKYRNRIIFANILTQDLSSSQIRFLLKQKRDYNSIRGLVDDLVYSYIRKNKLYK